MAGQHVIRFVSEEQRFTWLNMISHEYCGATFSTPMREIEEFKNLIAVSFFC